MLEKLSEEKTKLRRIKAYAHDDRLVLLATKAPTVDSKKSGYVPPLNLKKGWKAERCVTDNRDKNGERILVNYYTKDIKLYPIETVKKFQGDMESFHKKKMNLEMLIKEWIEYVNNGGISPHYIEKSEYEKLKPGAQALCQPIWEKAINISDGIKVVSKRNYMYLNLTCLPETLISRYRLSLNQIKALYDKKVINYTGKAASARNITEALRHQLYKKWHVHEYEHNILFDGKLGKTLFEDLKKHEVGEIKYVTTIYLKSGKGSQFWIKYYNVTAKDEKRNSNKKTDMYKLELTFRSPFFKAKNLRDIRDFIEQPDIQGILSSWIKEKIRWVINKLQRSSKAMLKNEYHVKNETELINAMLNKQRTYTSIQKRLDTLDGEIEKIKNRHREMETRLTRVEKAVCGL